MATPDGDHGVFSSWKGVAAEGEPQSVKQKSLTQAVTGSKQ